VEIATTGGAARQVRPPRTRGRVSGCDPPGNPDEPGRGWTSTVDRVLPGPDRAGRTGRYSGLAAVAGV
jgi:hypothetical protein